MAAYINVIVNGGNNFRKEAHEQEEHCLNMLCDLILFIQNQYKSEDIRSILLPAGFFCVPNEIEVNKLADKVAKRLSLLNPPFKIIWGIDGATDGKKGKKISKPKPPGHPYYIFALGPGQKEPTKFQQASVNSVEGRNEILLDTNWGNRPICIPKTKEALLICGEIWSDKLLKKVCDAQPEVLFVPAHQKVNLMTDPRNRWASMSWHFPLSKFSKTSGIPIMLSEHTRTSKRHTYVWPQNIRVNDLNLPHNMQSLFLHAKLVHS